jgi:hypothetical protein
MLILQHLWSRWDKHDRSAASAQAHLALGEVYPLPALVGPAPAAWRHEVRCLKTESFRIEQRHGPTTPDDWRHEEPLHPGDLVWRLTPAGAEISLHRPWGEMLRTAWPAALPSPVARVTPGRIVRIDWNGRFLGSMGGDRDYFYERHTYWLTVADRPEPGLFTEATPDKHIDLRTRIY